jgi:hypothetical protein
MKMVVLFIVLLAALPMVFADDSGAGDYDYYDQCNTGTGTSSNPWASQCDPAAFGKDCCGWYQDWHVHDLGSVVTGSAEVYATFMGGYYGGCTDRGIVSVSLNIDGPWTFIGYTDYGVAWQKVTTELETEEDFRYVKIDNEGGCYTDWSSVGVDEDGSSDDECPDGEDCSDDEYSEAHQEVPEFGTVAALVALAGAVTAFFLMRK